VAVAASMGQSLGAFEQGLNDSLQRLHEELRTNRRDCGENMIGSWRG
jgi:hypothetical protein